MKGFKFFVLLFAMSLKAFASDFHIEDPALKSVPRAVSKLLFQEPEAKDQECKGFIGSSVSLNGKKPKNDWIATTSNGCGWGASSASIWVVEKLNNEYRVVLFSGGQTATLGIAKQNGRRHIAIASGVATRYSETLYKFDGNQYKKVKYRFVDLTSDSKDCKKPENKDVCR